MTAAYATQQRYMAHAIYRFTAVDVKGIRHRLTVVCNLYVGKDGDACLFLGSRWWLSENRQIPSNREATCPTGIGISGWTELAQVACQAPSAVQVKGELCSLHVLMLSYALGYCKLER